MAQRASTIPETARAITDASEPSGTIGTDSQTLMRGLDLLESVAHEKRTLGELTQDLALTKSTTHRLASALVDRGYLAFTPRSGYRLGPKFLELGYLAQVQADLIQVARPHIESLASSTEDTVHLGVIDADQALYLDKVPGRRRINISSRVGDRQPLSSTGLGKALMFDHPPADWAVWHARMAGYVTEGRAFDLEENEDQIRCVSAPVRGVGGRIVGAIRVSSAAQYTSDTRMADLSNEVRETAHAISRDLGWAPKPKK